MKRSFFTQDSGRIFSGFILLLVVIGYFWWPLAEEYLSYIDWQGQWWLFLDWLLIGLFLFMSLALMYRADLRRDRWMLWVGVLGGLAIEGWGTQTNLWVYYTAERPPLWIIPAWPIAGLVIDRIVGVLTPFPSLSHPASTGEVRMLRILSFPLPQGWPAIETVIYAIIMGGFYVLMLLFVWPTLDKPLTLLSLLVCAIWIASERDRRTALITFLAGSGLGYFLELWGTTRLCWTYYTLETPPLFAVLAHGMAAIAFWRTKLLLQRLWLKTGPALLRRRKSQTNHQR